MSRYRDGYKGGIEKYDFSFTSISRALLLILTPIIAYIIGLIPIVFSFVYIIRYLDFSNYFHLNLLIINETSKKIKEE